MSTATVPILTKATVQELFEGVKRLSPGDLDEFADQVLTLRWSCKAKGLSKQETRLLQKINEKLHEPAQERLLMLDAKRRNGTLSSDEHEEMLAISDLIQEMSIERAKCLKELAELRQVPVKELMNQITFQ